jgi:hypothetical protein
MPCATAYNFPAQRAAASSAEATLGTADDAVPVVTVRKRNIPAWKCPGWLQNATYRPGFKLSVTRSNSCFRSVETFLILKRTLPAGTWSALSVMPWLPSDLFYSSTFRTVDRAARAGTEIETRRAAANSDR